MVIILHKAYHVALTACSETTESDVDSECLRSGWVIFNRTILCKKGRKSTQKFKSNERSGVINQGKKGVKREKYQSGSREKEYGMITPALSKLL